MTSKPTDILLMFIVLLLIIGNAIGTVAMVLWIWR